MISLDELFKFCIEFSSSDQAGFARYNELLKCLEISLTGNLRTFLIERAADNLINFQTAVEKKA